MNNGSTFLLNNVASAVLGDESEECHTETDLTLHSHPQHETSYLFTQSSPSERLCEVSVKCDVSCLQDTLSGVYDVELQAFNTTFRDWGKKKYATKIAVDVEQWHSYSNPFTCI